GRRLGFGCCRRRGIRGARRGQAQEQQQHGGQHKHIENRAQESSGHWSPVAAATRLAQALPRHYLLYGQSLNLKLGRLEKVLNRLAANSKVPLLTITPQGR